MGKKEDGCLRATGDSENCKGELKQRFTDLGTEIWECNFHYNESMDHRDSLRRRYPDSSTAPEWFDELYAGETWDED